MHLLAGRYILVKQIGKGGFGAVEEYTDSITKENVAIKTIPSRFVNQESHRLMREIDIMCFLHDAHPHVIGYFNIFVTKGVAVPNHKSSKASDDPRQSVAQTAENTEFELNVMGKHYEGLSDDERLRLHHEELIAFVGRLNKTDEFNVHIVMPLMKGDLFYFIRLLSSQSSVQRLGVTHQFLAQVAVVFAFQICFGLDYLHQCSIIHRDMKPDNVLVCLDVTNPYMSTALIADMGLARDTQHSDTIYICTRYYRPPEVITSVSGGSTRIDIWSLGCIFYEMCTGQTLFTMRTALNERGEWDGAKASLQLEVILNTIGTPTAEDIDLYMPSGNAKLYLQRSTTRPSQLRQLIEHHWILKTSGDEKEKWIDLITRCLAFFPEQRPTAKQLCEHQLFRDYNVFYGSNVKQYAPTPYKASFQGTSGSSRSENKSAILSLVQHALRETMPPTNEGSSDEVDSLEDNSIADRSIHNEGEVDDATDRVRTSTHMNDCVSSKHLSTSSLSDSRRHHCSSEHNEERAIPRVSYSAFDSVVVSSVPPPYPHPSSPPSSPPSQQQQQQRPYALPSVDINSSEYYGASYLDDDGDEGIPESDRGHVPNTEDEESFSYFPQPEPSVFMPRFSPGNVFRNNSELMPPRSAEVCLNDSGPATVRIQLQNVLARSASSEGSGPVVEDTPPLAPRGAFNDRVTCRRSITAEEDASYGLMAQSSSVLDPNNCRFDESDDVMMSGDLRLPQGTAPRVMVPVFARNDVPTRTAYNTVEGANCDTSQTHEPLAIPSAIHTDLYQYTSPFQIGSCPGVSMPPPPPSFYTKALPKEMLHSPSVCKPSDSGEATGGTGDVSSTAAAVLQGKTLQPGTETSQALESRGQYDYFVEAGYYPGPSSISELQVAAPRQPAKKCGTSQYSFDLLDGVPLEQASQRAGSPSSCQRDHLLTAASPPGPPYQDPSAKGAQSLDQQRVPPHFSQQQGGARFPPIKNQELRQRYMSYIHTPQSIQAATSAVLEELGGCTHDAERSSDLRELLNYYTCLQVSP